MNIKKIQYDSEQRNFTLAEAGIAGAAGAGIGAGVGAGIGALYGRATHGRLGRRITKNSQKIAQLNMKGELTDKDQKKLAKYQKKVNDAREGMKISKSEYAKKYAKRGAAIGAGVGATAGALLTTDAPVHAAAAVGRLAKGVASTATKVGGTISNTGDVIQSGVGSTASGALDKITSLPGRMTSAFQQ